MTGRQYQPRYIILRAIINVLLLTFVTSKVVYKYRKGYPEAMLASKRIMALLRLSADEKKFKNKHFPKHYSMA